MVINFCALPFRQNCPFSQTVIFGKPLRKQAVAPERQCANKNHRLSKEAVLSEGQCANGDHHMRTIFSKIPIGPL